MFTFKAYFWHSDVYINEKYKYAAGEILTAYLNTDSFDRIEGEDCSVQLKKYKKKLLLSEDMDYVEYLNYNSNVYKATNILENLNDIITKLPPYKDILTLPIKRLEDILNDYSIFFENGLKNDERENITWDTVSEYGTGEIDEYGNGRFRLHKFKPEEPEKILEYAKNFADELQNFNREVSDFFDAYTSFVESYLAVHRIFAPFIDGFLHRKETFLTDNELAEYFDAFNKTHGMNFLDIPCHMNAFRYKSLKDTSGNTILCEEIHFDDLQSFLYYDFFHGIRHNYILNKCKHCGKYFLIQGGKYFSYCNRPLEDDPSKTCRDVGSRRRYGDKCKNDPIWQTYSRAYKAHYARYMKKKMTISEFEKWSRFASEIRDKTIAGEIPFDEYYTEIRQ